MSNKITGVVTKEQIIPCQVTYQGNDYSPITHKQVIETMGEYLYKNSFKIKGEEYLAASNGQRVIGKIFLDYPDAECGFMLSFKNSLDGSMSFGLVSGSYTFICSNGSVYGDLSSYKRKHSGNATTEVLGQIEIACNQMEEAMKTHIWRRERMKDHDITKKTIAELCGRLYLDDMIISSNQLGIIKKEIENPSFDYCCDGTVWQLYQHCTHATKETTPLQWHKVHKNLGDFFNNEFLLGNPLVEVAEVEVLN